MSNFSAADISDNARAFSVDDVIAVTEAEPWVPELTVAEKIDAAKQIGLEEFFRLESALAEAIDRREAAQADINLLREALVIWEPIEHRLTNGPARRTRNEETPDALDVGI